MLTNAANTTCGMVKQNNTKKLTIGPCELLKNDCICMFTYCTKRYVYEQKKVNKFANLFILYFKVPTEALVLILFMTNLH
jgi:hypothetical protein